MNLAGDEQILELSNANIVSFLSFCNFLLDFCCFTFQLDE